MFSGQKEGAVCASFESFAYLNLGYHTLRELGPGEIVRITEGGVETLSPARKQMKICAFLWMYYGYPTSVYEGVNVEAMRCRNGEIMAKERRQRHGGIRGGHPGFRHRPRHRLRQSVPASPLPGPLSSTPPPGPGALCR